MGEAKQKQYSREAFLKIHTRCCYCGEPATTTDHCPPRAMFRDRKWPEGYEFPACHDCNQQGRLDEQVLAVLTKSLTPITSEREEKEWKKLLLGLENNQPELYADWQVSGSRNQLRRDLKRLFGDKADALRNSGHGVLSAGPLTNQALARCGHKLAQALYYKNVGGILTGQAWTRHLNPEKVGYEHIVEEAAKFTPYIASSKRGGVDLREQFIYRFDVWNDDAPGILALIRASRHLNFIVLGLSDRYVEKFRSKLDGAPGSDMYKIVNVGPRS